MNSLTLEWIERAEEDYDMTQLARKAHPTVGGLLEYYRNIIVGWVERCNKSEFPSHNERYSFNRMQTHLKLSETQLCSLYAYNTLGFTLDFQLRSTQPTADSDRSPRWQP